MLTALIGCTENAVSRYRCAALLAFPEDTSRSAMAEMFKQMVGDMADSLLARGLVRPWRPGKITIEIHENGSVRGIR